MLLGSALAAGDERLYAAAVMPALRALPPEAAHGLALRAAGLGLLLPARPDGPALVRLEGGGEGRTAGRAEGRRKGWGRVGGQRGVGYGSRGAQGSRHCPWRVTRYPRAGTQ